MVDLNRKLAEIAIGRGGEGVLIPTAAFGLAVKFLAADERLAAFVSSLSDEEATIVGVANEMADIIATADLSELGFDLPVGVTLEDLEGEG